MTVRLICSPSHNNVSYFILLSPLHPKSLVFVFVLRPSPALFQPSVISPAPASLQAKHVHFFHRAYSTLFGGRGGRALLAL